MILRGGLGVGSVEGTRLRNSSHDLSRFLLRFVAFEFMFCCETDLHEIKSERE